MCGRVVTVWEFDVCHRRSRKNGGTLALENLEVGCHECNQRQGTMDMPEYIKIRGPPPVAQDSTASRRATQTAYEKEWLALRDAEAKNDARPVSASSFHECAMAKRRLITTRGALSDLTTKRRRPVDLTFVERLELKKITGLEC